MKLRRITPLPQPDPQLRLDILITELGRASCRWAESKIDRVLGFDVNLWDGAGGLEEVVNRKLDDLDVPRKKLTAVVVCESLGLIKPKRIRRVG